MNLKKAVRWLAHRANEYLAQRMTLIAAGLLFLLGGFTVVTFLLNFDELQRLAEEDNFNRTIEASPDNTDRSVVVSPGNRPTTAEAAWLAPLNRYRAMVGLAPVGTDARLSRGDFLHSHYLAVNYAPQMPDGDLGAEVHTEDPANPGFTPEGAAAAGSSDIGWLWNPRSRPQPSWAIDSWMRAPFHRLQIINPYLHRVGYGNDCQGAVCFAALNIGVDVDPLSAISAPWPKPIFFPSDGSVMDSGMFSDEWPDPLTSCPEFKSPTGLPITLERGPSTEPGFSDYSVSQVSPSSGSIEACAFDANTYVNPDASAQSTARAILNHFGAIVIVPRHPLPPGRYVVALSAGLRYTWSFSIAAKDPD